MPDSAPPRPGSAVQDVSGPASSENQKEPQDLVADRHSLVLIGMAAAFR